MAPNLFYGASIPVSICVLNRNKPPERRERVLFVDANQEGCFRPGKAQNYLDPEHIARIVLAYQDFKDVDRFAHVSDLAEIGGNDFNLNISRYVDTTEPVAVMPMEEPWLNCGRRKSGATRRWPEWTNCWPRWDMRGRTEMSVPEAMNIAFTDDTLTAGLSDGRTISVPLAWYPPWCTPRRRRGATGS